MRKNCFPPETLVAGGSEYGWRYYEEDELAEIAIQDLTQKGILNDAPEVNLRSLVIDLSPRSMYEETATEPLRPTVPNFRITDEQLGEGNAKEKFKTNMDAIQLLKELEQDGGQATPEQQEILSKYVGWGGVADAFDADKSAWSEEYTLLKITLTESEYNAARASTLNAHYTTPTVIRAVYSAVENMGFKSGNILEPSCGVGNFFGCLPESMAASKLYGVELDSITGRIAKQLYPKANITVAGFEATDRRDFFDLAVGNGSVLFGLNEKSADSLRVYGRSCHKSAA